MHRRGVTDRLLCPTAGMVGCGMSGTFGQLLVWRWVTGVGSALQMAGAQLFLTDISVSGNRARTLGTNQARSCLPAQHAAHSSSGHKPPRQQATSCSFAAERHSGKRKFLVRRRALRLLVSCRVPVAPSVMQPGSAAGVRVR